MALRGPRTFATWNRRRGPGTGWSRRSGLGGKGNTMPQSIKGSTVRLSTAAWVLGAVLATGVAYAQPYRVTPLVSDVPGAAAHTDPHLVNGWGVAFNPTGF